MLPSALEVSYTDVLGAIREKQSLSELMVRIGIRGAQSNQLPLYLIVFARCIQT
jgi:hypothetical protein